MRALAYCVATGVLMVAVGPALCQQPSSDSFLPIKPTAAPAPQPPIYRLLPAFLRKNSAADDQENAAVAQGKEGEDQ